MKKLDNVEALALNRLVLEVNRKRVKPGTYPVDFTVRVSGLVEIGNDYDKTATVNLPTYGLIVTALKFAGVTQEEKILAAIEKAANKAMESDGKFEDTLSKKAKRMIDDIKSRFSETLPRVDCDGPVKVDLDVVAIKEAVPELAQ